MLARHECHRHVARNRGACAAVVHNRYILQTRKRTAASPALQDCDNAMFFKNARVLAAHQVTYLRERSCSAETRSGVCTDILRSPTLVLVPILMLSMVLLVK